MREKGRFYLRKLMFPTKSFLEDFLWILIIFYRTSNQLKQTREWEARFDCSEGIRKKPHKKSASDLLQYKTIVILISFKSLKNRIPRSQKKIRNSILFSQQHWAIFIHFLPYFWFILAFEKIWKYFENMSHEKIYNYNWLKQTRFLFIFIVCIII